MGFKIKAKVEGLGQILKRLEAVKKGRGQILRKALTKASKPVLDAARAKVPRDTGLTKKTLGRRIKVYRQSGTGVAVVGPRTGMKKQVRIKFDKVFRTAADGRIVRIMRPKPEQLWKFHNPVKTAHLVEYGTRRTAAQPFLRPAWDGNKGLVEIALIREIAAGIEAAAAKG